MQWKGRLQKRHQVHEFSFGILGGTTAGVGDFEHLHDGY